MRQDICFPGPYSLPTGNEFYLIHLASVSSSIEQEKSLCTYIKAEALTNPYIRLLSINPLQCAKFRLFPTSLAAPMRPHTDVNFEGRIGIIMVGVMGSGSLLMQLTCTTGTPWAQSQCPISILEWALLSTSDWTWQA